MTLIEVANIDPDTVYETKVNYNDNETFKIVHALASVLSTTVNDTYEILGEWVIEYACENGWNELLHAMADNLQQFLDNLNSMHFFIDRIAFESEMKGPVFKCESQNDGTLRLHYYSMRKDLYPMVKGLVRYSAKELFDIEVLIFVTERLQEKRNNLVSEHVIYTIESVEKNVKLCGGDTVKSGNLSNTVILEPLTFSMQSFCVMLPMHICFNKQMIIEHCGEFLQRELMLGRRRTTKLTDIFQVVQPDDIAVCLHFSANFYLGQMFLVNGGQNMLFIGSLNVSTIRGLVDSNVFISDMQMHDVTRDLIMLNQSRICQQELNKKLEETVKQMKKLAEELEVKKAQTDHLLFSCIPAEIADQLRKTHSVPAQEYAEATCLMLDMPYFSIINSQCAPKDIVILMTNLFHIYDHLIDLHDCYKVLSIMDCYFIIAGVPKICIDHADKILNLALGLMLEAKRIVVPKLDLPVMLRIAIHSGPVVAGVLGMKKIRYGVVGETVNIAKRLLLNSEPGKILVTNSTRL
uniref:Guanylate cyclase n=1 Tax=Panagrolaimus sp. ES5 TaxID=591445 RepID=A0AC34FTA4_9BILA